MKKVGRGHKRIHFTPVKLEKLNFLPDGISSSPITYQSLRDCGAVTKSKHKFWKLVGGGVLKFDNLVIHAYAFSVTARKVIEESGGQCVLLSKTRHKPIVDDYVKDKDKECEGKEGEGIVDVEVL